MLMKASELLAISAYCTHSNFSSSSDNSLPGIYFFVIYSSASSFVVPSEPA